MPARESLCLAACLVLPCEGCCFDCWQVAPVLKLPGMHELQELSSHMRSMWALVSNSRASFRRPENV